MAKKSLQSIFFLYLVFDETAFNKGLLHEIYIDDIFQFIIML